MSIDIILKKLVCIIVLGIWILGMILVLAGIAKQDLGGDAADGGHTPEKKI